MVKYSVHVWGPIHCTVFVYMALHGGEPEREVYFVKRFVIF